MNGKYPMIIKTPFNSNFFTSTFDDLFDTFLSSPQRDQQNYMTVPRANVIKNENGYSIELAAPGFTRDEFELSVDSNTLSVKVGTSDTPGYDKDVVSREYKFQTFTRSWSLPDNVNVEAVTARYEAGILLIDVPVENNRKLKKMITVD